MRIGMLPVSLLLACAPALSAAQVVGIALDPKVAMVDGELQFVAAPPPDSVEFLEFSGADARLPVQAPTSFQGPPSSVAITADRKLALVSALQCIDSADPEAFAPDNRLTVVDLAAPPFRVVQTIELPAPPATVAVDPAGTMALASHTEDNSVTVLALSEARVRVVGTVPLGEGGGPQDVVFAPDGKQVLISFPEHDRTGVFAVANGRLETPAIRELSAGVYPTALAYCGRSGLAVVANYGRVTGDVDTVSVLDVGATVPRVIDTASVGPAPEGIACSPDGRYVAVSLQNMSTVPKGQPYHSPQSRLVVLEIEGRRLQRVAEAPFGAWAQGVGFLDDPRTLFAQSMVDRSLHLFRLRDGALEVAAPPIAFENVAPVAYGIPGR